MERCRGSGAMPTADALYLIDESWAKARYHGRCERDHQRCRIDSETGIRSDSDA